jgi:hypothetical protein
MMVGKPCSASTNPMTLAIFIMMQGLEVAIAKAKPYYNLDLGGFSVESLWSDLTGKQYSPDSDWIGIIAGKK